MTGPGVEFTAERAGAVLTAALSAPGSGEAVLRTFADLPTVRFTPAQAGRLLRRGTPAQLLAGQWMFTAVEPGGTRVQISHVVHDVSIQSRMAGPAEAGPALALALLDAASEYGPQAVTQVQVLLYGIAVVNGLA